MEYLQYWYYLTPLLGLPIFYLVRAFASSETKKRAVEVAGVLKMHGLNKLSGVLVAAATGSVRDIGKAVYELVDEYNDGSLDQELDEMFEKMLTAHAANPEKRAKLLAKLNSLGITSP